MEKVYIKYCIKQIVRLKMKSFVELYIVYHKRKSVQEFVMKTYYAKNNF